MAEAFKKKNIYTYIYILTLVLEALRFHFKKTNLSPLAAHLLTEAAVGAPLSREPEEET